MYLNMPEQKAMLGRVVERKRGRKREKRNLIREGGEEENRQRERKKRNINRN